MAKQGSYAIGVCRFDTSSLEGILDLQLAASKVTDILVEVSGTFRLQPFQRPGDPTLESGTDRRELQLDCRFGKLIRTDSKRRRGPLQIAERFLIAEAKRKNGSRASHIASLHLPGPWRRTSARHFGQAGELGFDLLLGGHQRFDLCQLLGALPTAGQAGEPVMT
jgi:hypothetical protein